MSDESCPNCVEGILKYRVTGDVITPYSNLDENDIKANIEKQYERQAKLSNTYLMCCDTCCFAESRNRKFKNGSQESEPVLENKV